MLPAFSNTSVPFTRSPATSGAANHFEHDVLAARNEFDRLARLDLDAFVEQAHFHHVAFFHHVMDRNLARGGAGDADQTVGLRAAHW